MESISVAISVSTCRLNVAFNRRDLLKKYMYYKLFSGISINFHVLSKLKDEDIPQSSKSSSLPS